MLDETQKREILAMVAIGGNLAMAAQYIGVHVASVRAEQRHDPGFAERLQKSELRSEVSFLKAIQAAAGDPKQWRAAAWALERLYPERYGRRAPKTIPLERMQELMSQTIDIIAAEVPVKRHREQLQRRLREFVKQIPSCETRKRSKTTSPHAQRRRSRRNPTAARLPARDRPSAGSNRNDQQCAPQQDC